MELGLSPGLLTTLDVGMLVPIYKWGCRGSER